MNFPILRPNLLVSLSFALAGTFVYVSAAPAETYARASGGIPNLSTNIAYKAFLWLVGTDDARIPIDPKRNVTGQAKAYAFLTSLSSSNEYRDPAGGGYRTGTIYDTNTGFTGPIKVSAETAGVIAVPILPDPFAKARGSIESRFDFDPVRRNRTHSALIKLEADSRAGGAIVGALANAGTDPFVLERFSTIQRAELVVDLLAGLAEDPNAEFVVGAQTNDPYGFASDQKQLQAITNIAGLANLFTLTVRADTNDGLTVDFDSDHPAIEAAAPTLQFDPDPVEPNVWRLNPSSRYFSVFFDIPTTVGGIDQFGSYGLTLDIAGEASAFAQAVPEPSAVALALCVASLTFLGWRMR